MIALTHLPSPRMNECVRSDASTGPINMMAAQRQHEAYCDTLQRNGATVRTLNVSPQCPDSVFIEDTAVILDELVIITSPGHPARREETTGLAPILREYRPVIERIELPATIDGGDVLRMGRSILVGLSERTNLAGATALREIAARHGYVTTILQLGAGLHFKSACTALPGGRLLVNPQWIDVAALQPFTCVPVAVEEPHAANVLLLGEAVIASASYPHTAELIESLGFSVDRTPLSEFAKADGAVTCLSLLFSLPDDQA